MRAARITTITALLLIGVGALVAAFNGERFQRIKATTAGMAVAPSEPGAVRVAKRYALAARNWSAESYAGSYRRQLVLASPAHRRALRAAAPTSTYLAQLRADRARSRARFVQAELEPGRNRRRARVLVELREVTSAGGGKQSATTVNEVRLVRPGGRWLVDRWTAVPDIAAL
jgi:hypothetical protein